MFFCLHAWADDGRDKLPDLLSAIKQARLSDGFEVRLAITLVDAQKVRSAPIKVAVIGQVNADRQRFLVRGISPEAIRNRYIATMKNAAGSITAFEYGPDEAGRPVSLDLFAGIFKTDFVIWDLFGAWWDWPYQTDEGFGEVHGRRCLSIRSRPAAVLLVKEVVSCVDREHAVALSTQLYDTQNRLRRTILVEKLMRRNSGAGVTAKRITIVDEHGAHSEIEVYGGDEQYQVSPETFGALERLSGKPNSP